MVSVTTDDITGMGPFIARLSRFGQRLRRADEARPWALDVAVAALVAAVFCVPDLLNGGAVDGDAPRAIRTAFTELPVPGMLALQCGLVLPLVWRRRRPWPVFTVIWAFFVAQWALGAVLRADIALFIALHNLALRGRIRQLPWACGTVLGAMVLVTLQVSTVLAAWVALFFLLSTPTAALALGLAMRIRRAQLAGLRERAARLETERDQRGRLAVAVERARVAREMHDVVGHNLSVMITLADAERTPPTSPRTAAKKLSCSSATPDARHWTSCDACSACCATPAKGTATSPNSAPSPASPTSTSCATACAPPDWTSSIGPGGTSMPWTVACS